MTDQPEIPEPAPMNDAEKAVRQAQYAVAALEEQLDAAVRERDEAIGQALDDRATTWARLGELTDGLSRKALHWSWDRHTGRGHTDLIARTSAERMTEVFPWLERLDPENSTTASGGFKVAPRTQAIAELKVGAQIGDPGPAWAKWRERAGRTGDSRFDRPTGS